MKELIKFLDKYNISYTVEGDYVIADNIKFSNNNLTELPESFGNIKFSNNNLTELPESFGNIKGGDILFLNSDNKITELPESFGNLKIYLIVK